jgi:hypothetical protein
VYEKWWAEGKMEPGVLAIDWKLESLEKRAPVTFELRVDGRVVRPPDRPALNPATGVAVVPLRQELEPGKYKLMAVARKNDPGVEQAHFVSVEVTGKPRPKPRRLTVVTIAPSFDDPQLPEIKFAARDMDRLPPFFTQYLVDSNGASFQERPGPRLVGRDTTGTLVLATLEALGRGPVEPGDMAVVILESHVLSHLHEVRIAVAESKGMPPKEALSADAVAEALGSLVGRGCKVLVVLDGVHENVGAGAWSADVQEWVRTLHHEHQVITFFASLRRPSQVFRPAGLRTHAQAILEAITRARTIEHADGPPIVTLYDFRKAVLAGLENMTQRRGDANLLIPDSLLGGMPLLTLHPVAVPASPRSQ